MASGSVFSTPRTKEACRRAGISPEDLEPKDFSAFYVRGDFLERQKLRFNRFESRRQQKLNVVMEERAKVIQEKIEEQTSNDLKLKSVQSIAALETLVGKEARRLEKDLRSQLRFFETVERDNSEQLKREEALKALIESRLAKKANAESLRMMKSEGLRAIRLSKERQHEESTSKLQSEHGEKAALFRAHLDEEEHRLQDFLTMKESDIKDKSAAWLARVDRIKDNMERVRAQAVNRGAELVTRHQNKLFVFERRKREEERHRLLRHEEKTLRLGDAKDRRKRIRNVESAKRDMIAAQLDEEMARVATLIATKDEIMRQRQAILREQESVKGKPVNIKNILPGPADYSNFADCVHEGPSVKISDVKPKLLIPGSTDFEIKKSKELPPPGAYNPRVLPSGQHCWDDVKVTIAKSEKKTYLDEQRSAKKDLPGPGAYYAPEDSTAKLGAPKLVRDYYEQDPWYQPKQPMPGPGQYTVDEFTRMERLKKSQKAIPALAKALMMTIPKRLGPGNTH